MSTRTQKSIIGVLLIACVVLGLGIIFSMPPFSENTTNPLILDPVPPSEHPPENSTTYETITLGSLILNATGTISGMIPHTGPITFYMNLMINVTNNGTEDVSDFHATKMSLYYQSSELFYTFSFSSDANATIPAGETVTLNYLNQETHIDTSFSIGSYVYARILVSFNTDQECILTTPTLEGIFAIE